MASKDQAIVAMLQRFARSFTSGDGAGAAACWEVPALVVSGDGSRAVQTLDEVAGFFGGAQAQYHAQGVTGTRPEIQKTDWHTSDIAAVTVQWPYLDAQDKPLGRAERSVYLVRVRDEAAKIVAVVMVGEES